MWERDLKSPSTDMGPVEFSSLNAIKWGKTGNFMKWDWHGVHVWEKKRPSREKKKVPMSIQSQHLNVHSMLAPIATNYKDNMLGVCATGSLSLVIRVACCVLMNTWSQSMRFFRVCRSFCAVAVAPRVFSNAAYSTHTASYALPNAFVFRFFPCP